FDARKVRQMLGFDSIDRIIDLHDRARPDELFEFEFVYAAGAFDKMIRRIDMRRAVHAETHSRNVCRGAVRYRELRLYFYLRIALVDRKLCAQRNGNIEYFHIFRIIENEAANKICLWPRHLLE